MSLTFLSFTSVTKSPSLKPALDAGELGSTSVTKAPVAYSKGCVRCDATSMTYMVDRSGAVNFLEPEMHRDGRAGRARQAARLVTERLG